MRLAALFSGGKDSVYAVHLASGIGDVVYLITMIPRREDSWMYHTVNIHLASLLAEAQGIEHLPVKTLGNKEDEVRDLSEALKDLDIDCLVTGAIASQYQKKRIDSVCESNNLKHLTPLWGKSEPELLDDVFETGMVVMVSAVAAMGLTEEWLGRILDHDSVNELKDLSRRYGFSVCGEGGEMETLVLDAPWFDKRLRIEKGKRHWDGVSGSFIVEKAALEPRILYA